MASGRLSREGGTAKADERLSERDKWGQHSWGRCKFYVFRKTDFLGTPVNLLLSCQKCQGVFFSQSAKIHPFCSGPISADPICPQLRLGVGPARDEYVDAHGNVHGFLIYLFSTLCGPVVSSAGAHGFVHVSHREPFGEQKEKRLDVRAGSARAEKRARRLRERRQRTGEARAIMQMRLSFFCGTNL